MPYKVVFRTKRGNTTVSVEDLARSGQFCTHCTVGQYPGVCEHCGKLHIRYLAHVEQDIADTLLRATKEDVENPLQRSDEEIANLGLSLLDRKFSKEKAVGCVCVQEYLADCGVDVGLAKRFQFEVSRITRYLQQIAYAEAAQTPERLAESVRRATIVRRLQKRYDAIRCVRVYGNPKLATDEAYARFQSVCNVAYKDYNDSRKRWETENPGWNLYYHPEPTVDKLRASYENEIAHAVRKLRVYQSDQGVTIQA